MYSRFLYWIHQFNHLDLCLPFTDDETNIKQDIFCKCSFFGCTVHILLVNPGCPAGTHVVISIPDLARAVELRKPTSVSISFLVMG